MTKTAVITGGNRGIGLGITEALVKAGYRVVVGARTLGELTTPLVDSLQFVAMDVRDPDAHQHLTQTALEISGRLDVYVNNAGFSKWRPITDISTAAFDTMIDVNLKGVFWGCKAAANALCFGGSIINISSLAGKRGSANNSLYCATKFAVNGLTQSLAKELGARGIRVNALCPVLIETQGLRAAITEPHAPAATGFETFMAHFASTNAALGRLPTAAEVGAAVTFLASEGAAAITGQCLNIDCGVFPQ